MRLCVFLKFIGGPLCGDSVEMRDNEPLPTALPVPIMPFGKGSVRVWSGCPESMAHAIALYVRDGVSNKYNFVSMTKD